MPSGQILSCNVAGIWWTRAEYGEHKWGKRGKLEKDCIQGPGLGSWDLVELCSSFDDFAFYSQWDKKLLEGFMQKSDVIAEIILAAIIESGLYRGKGGSKEIYWGLWLYIIQVRDDTGLDKDGNKW